MEKLEWCGYPMVNNVEHMFTRFDRIHERDRQTDRQRPRESRQRRLLLNIASRPGRARHKVCIKL